MSTVLSTVVFILQRLLDSKLVNFLTCMYCSTTGVKCQFSWQIPM